MATAAPLNSDTPWQAHVHRSHQSERRTLMWHLIERADAEVDPSDLDTPHPARKLARRLEACCRHPGILQDEVNGEVLLSSDSCNSRVCPRCGHRRGRELREVIDQRARELDWPAMITLTVQGGDASLSDAIQHLRDSFARLRRSQGWKSHVFGGISVLEVTHNASRNSWHPHLHVLVDMVYWAQSELADAWLTATGDSRIVDVRRVSGPVEAANYIAKYVTKGKDVMRLPSRCIAEYCLAMHGRRMAQPFGRCHGKKTTLPKPERAGRLVQIGLLPQIYEAALADDPDAQELWPILINRPRIDASAAEPGAGGDDLAADRDLADVVRAFCQHDEGDHDGTPARRSDPGSGSDPPDQRPLWEREDVSAQAVAGPVR